MSEKFFGEPETNLSRLIITGCAGIFLLVGVFGCWAALTQISGAVTATGRIDVAGKPKQVQSLDGGILAELSVKNGDAVREGQVLARLDPTLLRVNVDMTRSRLAVALSQRVRLEAEHAEKAMLIFDYSGFPLAVRNLNLDMSVAEANQRSIFNARYSMRQAARKRIESRLKDIQAQIIGNSEQIYALELQISFLDHDIDTLITLIAKRLTPNGKLTEIQRLRAALQGELASRVAEKSRLATARTEIELEGLQDEQRFLEQVVTALHDVTAELEQLTLSIVTRQSQLDRMAIRAPADGVVHELQITTVGGIIAPGGTLMEIVPQNSKFEFEVRVDPGSIKDVRQNQSAQIVLSALDQQNTPKLMGWVRAISPEVIRDALSGQSFYRVSIAIPETQLARLPKTSQLIPGMPLEAFLQTHDKSVLRYLTEPLGAHLRRGFRE